jgi:DNA-binding GntR family transcriptional regulator
VLQPSLIEKIGGSIDGDLILSQHREILRAVRRGQAAGASRAMERHLRYLRELVRAFEECPDNQERPTRPRRGKRSAASL